MPGRPDERSHASGIGIAFGGNGKPHRGEPSTRHRWVGGGASSGRSRVDGPGQPTGAGREVTGHAVCFPARSDVSIRGSWCQLESLAAGPELVGLRERGDSHKCFIHSILHDGFHSKQACLTAEVLGRFTAEGHLSEDRVHEHQFKDRLAAAKAGVLTLIATASPREACFREIVGCDFKGFEL